jgi:transposase
MKKVEMYYTVKTLLENGKNVSEIARICGIDRKTVRKIRNKIKEGHEPPLKVDRAHKLKDFNGLIESLVEQGFSAVLIKRRLKQDYNINVSYSTVQREVKKIKGEEAFAPVVSAPGEEAQVDFGYAGLFNVDGSARKCWVFCMVLSFSRYAYYELVLDQKIDTFLACHKHAFNFFNGVPHILRLDNLKTAISLIDRYEPELQKEYAEFLDYYSAGYIVCHVRSPREKGKVESGVKYIKANCLKYLKTKDFKEAGEEIRLWNTDVCNKRLHGTTRKVPEEIFIKVEKGKLIPLKETEYEICRFERRRVNRFGHVAFEYSFYSVPYKYVGEEVMVKTNGKLIHIFKESTEIAVHQVSLEKGVFVTMEGHKMPYKQEKGKNYYDEKASLIGEDAVKFLASLREKFPGYWYRTMEGVFHLEKVYGAEIVNKACRRAVQFKQLRYKAIKDICEGGWYAHVDGGRKAVKGKGFYQDLKCYDALTLKKGR